MSEDQVGVVADFYTRLGVAAISVTSGSIRKGDLLKFRADYRFHRRSDQHGN